MLQLSAEFERTSGPFIAPLNTQCLSGTLFGNRSINSLLWGKLQQTGVPAPAPVYPFFLSWRAHGVFSGQIRLWMRVNMCTRGLEDGIRVLPTYGLAFLPSIPAVSAGTMGSLLQTGELMNILGVKCFIALNIQYLVQALLAISCIHTEVFSSVCYQNDAFCRVLTCLPTSRGSLELHFQLDRTIPPRFLPCWHDKRGQSLIPGLCYEGDSGVNDWLKSPEERNVWILCSQGADEKPKAKKVKKKKFTCMIYQLD